ncbi:hypothetical protein GBA65_07485 [Rubrobacter marinus]|uniref:Bacterial spore germination immunoglobulin-like domain-containing protein n=1 Tax=Rubrobacter marinus TaxID=2653852 RepID=A0A6G8PVZ9_9ACTN|nr:Gmad2 immunoglobulin-like domain-containing protein [Rubrobacter marinus]QIN78391.1 hypothetical protein GBA65_07485 [Rubrobacter marinus]
MSRGVSRYFAAVPLVVLLIAGCGGEGGTRLAPQEENASAATTMSQAGDVEAEEPDRNAEGKPSSWSGPESGGGEGAANRIRDVELDYLRGYDRVRIAFGSGEGEASRIPRWSVEKPPEGGYVRLLFPGVTSTQTAGEDLAGLTTDAYYVVQASDGGLFVDVLALDAFEYRVTELTEAGQLAIDFRNAPGGLTCPAVQAENVVVTEPCEAEEAVAGEPLPIEGYSRNPKGSIVAVLLDEQGAPIARETIRAEDGNGAWGRFEATITAPPAYEGLATLRIGDENPIGTQTGAEVPVFFGVSQDG